MSSSPSSSPSSSSNTNNNNLNNNNTHQTCFRPRLFQNRVALVTGGGTGIGKAIATELAALGATVVIASRTVATCEQAAAEITKQYAHARVLVGPSTSIRRGDEIERLVAWVIQQTGALHYLVNNAGGQFLAPAETISARGFGAVVETNLTGTFLCCKEAYLQYMQDHGRTEPCAIVNITLGNRNGMPYMSHSGAARAGVENLAATLCQEWIGAGVRINNVRPGIIYTDSGFDNYGEAAEEFLGKILPSLPSKRLGTAQEISSAVVWLLSDGASYVTGATIPVDGGSSYTTLPFVETDGKACLAVYGDLPARAKL